MAKTMTEKMVEKKRSSTAEIYLRLTLKALATVDQSSTVANAKKYAFLWFFTRDFNVKPHAF